MPLMASTTLCFWVQRVFTAIVFCTFFCWKKKRDKNTNLVKPRPNDRNILTQHIASLLGATGCVRLASLLRCVATCWEFLSQVWKWSNLSQQHATCRNRVAKRTQHVEPNNVAISCVDMLRSFGRGFTPFRLQYSFVNLPRDWCSSLKHSHHVTSVSQSGNH